MVDQWYGRCRSTSRCTSLKHQLSTSESAVVAICCTPSMCGCVVAELTEEGRKQKKGKWPIRNCLVRLYMTEEEPTNSTALIKKKEI